MAKKVHKFNRVKLNMAGGLLQNGQDQGVEAGFVNSCNGLYPAGGCHFDHPFIFGINMHSADGVLNWDFMITYFPLYFPFSFP